MLHASFWTENNKDVLHSRNIVRTTSARDVSLHPVKMIVVEIEVIQHLSDVVVLVVSTEENQSPRIDNTDRKLLDQLSKFILI